MIFPPAGASKIIGVPGQASENSSKDAIAPPQLDPTITSGRNVVSACCWIAKHFIMLRSSACRKANGARNNEKTAEIRTATHAVMLRTPRRLPTVRMAVTVIQILKAVVRNILRATELGWRKLLRDISMSGARTSNTFFSS